MYRIPKSLIKRLELLEAVLIPPPPPPPLPPGHHQMDFGRLNFDELYFVSDFMHERGMNIYNLTDDEADCLEQIVLKGKGFIDEIKPKFEIVNYSFMPLPGGT